MMQSVPFQSSKMEHCCKDICKKRIPLTHITLFVTFTTNTYNKNHGKQFYLLQCEYSTSCKISRSKMI